MHRSRAPVAEAVGVTGWVASRHGDESKEDEHDEEDDLGEGHDELSLAEPLDSSNIQQDTAAHCHGNPGCCIGIRTPVSIEL